MIFVILLLSSVSTYVVNCVTFNDTFLLETYPDYTFYTICTCSTCWWNETRGIFYTDRLVPESYCMWIDFDTRYNNQYEYENYNVHYPAKLNVRQYTRYNSSYIPYVLLDNGTISNNSNVLTINTTNEGRMMYQIYAIKHYVDLFYPNTSVSWKIKADWIVDRNVYVTPKECIYYDMNEQKFMFDGCINNYTYLGIYREDGWNFRIYNSRYGDYHYVDYKVGIVDNKPLRTTVDNLTYPYPTYVIGDRYVDMSSYNYALSSSAILILCLIIFSGVYTIPIYRTLETVKR